VTAPVDVQLEESGWAVVHGHRVPFDGLVEGLAWPALDKAVGPRRLGQVLTLRVARALPMTDVLRAAWTLRQSDLRLETEDAAHSVGVLTLGAKGSRAAPGAADCHLAVFVQPGGSLRVASPGGPAMITGQDPKALLSRSLEDARRACPLRYVAFGAESDAAAWGTVFDVALAVESSGATGEARVVLAQVLAAR
jgi:hypothetical protein